LENTNSKRIEIPSVPEGLTLVEAFLDSIRDEYCFREDVCGNVIIAVTEAVNNSIYHGNKCSSDKKIRLQVEAPLPYKLIITIEDEGVGFNPDALPDPTSPELIDKPGGRGVFLMRELADNVIFKNNGSLVELHFNI